MKKRLLLKIFGDVQGVSFRYYTCKKADELGLTGWVANDPRGTVSIISEGEEKALKSLLNWSRLGPSYAKVDKVEVNWDEYQGEFSTFDIKT